jgi:diadenosine tetraphosphate (Ap4A) HIT family hydrolase
MKFVRNELDAKYHPAGYNIGINEGKAAGQSVDHLHIHLIPRYFGDAENPRGGVRNILNSGDYFPELIKDPKKIKYIN